MFNPAVSLPRFASHIRFVTSEEFQRLPLEQKPSVTENRRNNIGTFSQIAYTDGILMCNAGGVTANSPEKLVLFHFYGADLGSPQAEIRALTDSVKPLKAFNRNVRALLLGGEAPFRFSVEMGDALKRFFSKAGIPLSVFWGHTEWGSSKVAYLPNTDTWYVSTKYNHPPSDPLKAPDRFDVESLQDLKDAFEEISLDPGDDVTIGGRTYQSADVSKKSPSQ
jgi:hypothetical protein